MRDRADGFARRSTCDHKWKPLSFVFETRGERPFAWQPDVEAGRVYCVCMKCASHTYVTTQWVGFYLGGDRCKEEEDDED